MGSWPVLGFSHKRFPTLPTHAEAVSHMPRQLCQRWRACRITFCLVHHRFSRSVQFTLVFSQYQSLATVQNPTEVNTKMMCIYILHDIYNIYTHIIRVLYRVLVYVGWPYATAWRTWSAALQLSMSPGWWGDPGTNCSLQPHFALVTLVIAGFRTWDIMVSVRFDWQDFLCKEKIWALS